jgi:SpoVK/Ycf46/Vps4 family AAA+-type ATPase
MSEIKMYFEGLPQDLQPKSIAVFKTRLNGALSDLIKDANTDHVAILSGTHQGIQNMIDKLYDKTSDKSINQKDQAKVSGGEKGRDNDEVSLDQRAKQYSGQEPIGQMERLIIPDSLRSEIQNAIQTINLESLIFDEWGVREIEPFPRSSLNFYGPPGTGKTFAAHCIAKDLGRKILAISYAQVESKYHGDGPKNIEAVFFAAERDQAILFIDEADSLLSRRLTNVTSGSEQAINSMRSQLLICMEKFKGIVIFATNLVENYDEAFETRVRHISFPMPNVEARIAIWKNHFPNKLPLAETVDVVALAEHGELCGREIKNAVVSAAISVASDSRLIIEQKDLIDSIDKITVARNALRERKAQKPANAALTELVKQRIEAQKPIEEQKIEETKSATPRRKQKQ